MKIGIDISVLGRGVRTGISNYVSQLKEQSEKMQTRHQFVFFEPQKKRIPFWSSHIAMTNRIRHANLDVLHGPANTLPLLHQGHSVLTIHDLAIYKHPEWFPQAQWFSKKIVVPQSIKKADKIIVPSHATMNDLQELFNVTEKKIVVIPHGVDGRFISDKRLEGKYILSVGTLEPRKNISRLVEAYAKLPRELINKYELVVVGGQGWGGEEQKARAIVQNLNLDRRVRFQKNVSVDDLPQCYRDAALFVYPSLYEGFGLPLLEAMASRVPVVTSNGSSLREVAGDVALGVDPYDVNEISQAMKRILEDNSLSESMSSWGFERARHFTWDETFKRTVVVYEQTA